MSANPSTVNKQSVIKANKVASQSKAQLNLKYKGNNLHNEINYLLNGKMVHMYNRNKMIYLK